MGDNFTPALVVEGPSNSVWFVAARCVGTTNIQQVAVHMQGKAVNVQMETYSRVGQSWRVHPTVTSSVIALQHKIQNVIDNEK